MNLTQKIKIRKAKAADLSTLGKLAEELYIHNTRLKHRSPYLVSKQNRVSLRQAHYKKVVKNMRNAFFIAFKNKIPIGFIACAFTQNAPAFKKQKIGIITEIYVVPSARGLNIGSKLINCAVEWFSSHKTIIVKVKCWHSNSLGRAFYEKCGFKQAHINYEKKI